MTNNIDSSTRILRQLYFLRYLTIGFLTIMMLVAIYLLEIILPLVPLIIVLCVMVAINLATWFLIRSDRGVSGRMLLAQLTAEILCFSVILYFAGGATNPFTFYYLIPLAISATLIPGIRTWGLTVLTIGLYSLLLQFYVPLVYKGHAYHQPMSHDDLFSQHVIGMWCGFLLSALLVTWFVTYLSRELKQRDEAIHEARERELFDQQLVALGTLAAGTAHELGTPLASLAVLSDEITHGFDEREHPELFENQQILNRQVQRCKQILSVLSRSAGEMRADEGFLFPPDDFIDRLIKQWHESRPDAEYRLQKQHSNELKLLFDKTIIQAGINLLNNSADESEEPIQINTRSNEQVLIIEIIDDGDGFSDTQIRMAGETSFTDKPDGMGIGLFLAINTLRRCGGSVEFEPLETQGTRTIICLPMIA